MPLSLREISPDDKIVQPLACPATGAFPGASGQTIESSLVELREGGEKKQALQC